MTPAREQNPYNTQDRKGFVATLAPLMSSVTDANTTSKLLIVVR